MKLIKNLKYHLLKPALALVLLAGCTSEFEEINSNPNLPEVVTPDLLLSGVERDVVGSLLGETWGIGNIVIQQTAKNQFVNEDRYLWGELNSIWNSVYDNMRDVRALQTLAEQTGERNYQGIALILKSWMFSLVTDCYGDVPYSQATQAKSGGIYYTQYDTQQSIYTGILDDLEEANTLLDGAINVKGDIIFGGSVAKWRKLANSLRVRYLMRISDRVDVGAQLQAILNDPAANPVFEGNSDNAVYTYQANSPDQFPLFSTRIGSFNEFRASKTMMDELVALDDQRHKVFFRPTPETEATPSTADDEYVGIPNGMDDVSALTYNGGPQFQSRIGPLFYEQANSPDGIKVAKGVIMTFAELQFILAEAREKGLIAVGDAVTYYGNGIDASFGYYGITPDPAYFTQPDVDYSGTTDQKLAKIGKQKWIGLFFQGLEAWFDWRRTGYPALTPSVDNQNEDRIPVRFIYPIIEQSLNGENRAAAVARQGADDINTRVWWDVSEN
ncbi:MAG: SusD/RagB family nutrient-binding outer membrane lipoprotein [Bacteroidia bacterium]|nr:SusD/RagB family nutrient-binding outer membrane lipoprotein [Bacteroidia bacterium]